MGSPSPAGPVVTASTAPSSIIERISAVRERVAGACARAGRTPEDVALIAVSKTWPADAVLDAASAGLTDFGENRVQEALAKMDAYAGLAESACFPAPAWHLIGHLQTNKARAAVGRFAILHAIDSERLLLAIGAAAEAPQRVMIEVNVAAEATKFGVTPGDLPRLLEVSATLPNINVEGLMTVAPISSNPEASRPHFRALGALAAAHGLTALSMGMTGDFEVAIEEGATHIRVGRAIFGERA